MIVKISIALFIVFIILPFILLCSALMINLMIEIIRDLKEHFQELLHEKER